MTPATSAPPSFDLLIGDPTKATTKLGWKPSVTFTQLVHLMVDTNLHALPDTPAVRQAMAMMHD